MVPERREWQSKTSPISVHGLSTYVNIDFGGRGGGFLGNGEPPLPTPLVCASVNNTLPFASIYYSPTVKSS